MQYNAEFGGSILDADGKPALNSRANIESLAVYKKLFDKAAPPGAADYDWGGREESFRQGLVAQHADLVGRRAPAMTIPKPRRSPARSRIMLTPSAKGLPQKYGIGGWALGDQRRHRRQEEGSRLGLHQMGDQPGGAQGVQPARRRQLSAQERD